MCDKGPNGRQRLVSSKFQIMARKHQQPYKHLTGTGGKSRNSAFVDKVSAYDVTLIQRNDPAADNAFFCSPLVSVAIAIYYSVHSQKLEFDCTF